MRVCKEWGSLLLNEEVEVVCESQKATNWINSFFSSTNFINAALTTVVRAFGLATGARALWIDLGKRKVRIRHYDARMVVPLSWDEDGNKNVTISFGEQDRTVFRKAMSTEETIQEFAPDLRTNEQIEALRMALQMLGDLTSFGINYFDADDSRGCVKTAREVSPDNSALMRNIRRHETGAGTR